jgi:hypothetical protein
VGQAPSGMRRGIGEAQCVPAAGVAPAGDLVGLARPQPSPVGFGAAPRTGEILAALGSPAGSMVTVWLDASGKLPGPPLQPAQSTDGAIAAAVVAPTVLTLSLLTTLWLAQGVADRRRLAAWDSAWSTVGPQWNRRKP